MSQTFVELTSVLSTTWTKFSPFLYTGQSRCWLEFQNFLINTFQIWMHQKLSANVTDLSQIGLQLLDLPPIPFLHLSEHPGLLGFHFQLKKKYCGWLVCLDWWLGGKVSSETTHGKSQGMWWNTYDQHLQGHSLQQQISHAALESTAIVSWLQQLLPLQLRMAQGSQDIVLLQILYKQDQLT